MKGLHLKKSKQKEMLKIQIDNNIQREKLKQKLEKYRMNHNTKTTTIRATRTTTIRTEIMEINTVTFQKNNLKNLHQEEEHSQVLIKKEE